MGTGGSSLPSSPLLLYISTFSGSYIYILYLSHAGIRRSRFFMADLLSSCNLALPLIRYEKLLTQQSDRFSKRFWERWAKLYRPYSENAFAERFGKDALCCGFVLCLHGYEKINNYIANLRKSFFHIAFLSLKLVKIIDYSVMKRFSFSI